MGLAAILWSFVALGIAAIDGWGLLVGYRLWRDRKKPGSSSKISVRGFLAGGVVVFLGTNCVGVAAGVLTAVGSARGESIDPSQKARLLAQGISEAMNCSVFGLLGCLPISLAILGYAFVRARRDRGA